MKYSADAAIHPLKGQNMQLNVIEDIPQTSCVDERQVILRTAGARHGAITRLMSPGDLGQVIKPFVFLDDFAIPSGTNSVFAMHPHSGIATLTLVLTGSVWINDTVGTSADVNAGDIEWMRASGGAWHESATRGNEPITGLQLWLTLPTHLENAAPYSSHIAAQTVPRIGPASVLLGTYQGVQGPVPHDEGINYLNVELNAQSTWEYVPPTGHSVAWVYVYRGQLKTAGEVFEKEMIIFQSGETPIQFTADESVGFVIGSAVPHNHDLVMGPYSVHTSQQALTRGLAEINRIGATLKSG
jgi:redox-sensitive bicupin YhaK (pirin superfamily)